ncbi:MAG: transglycosylase domain-containing protein, partial [Deltaproteobacteria bacterium]|nr:transglycosylase domain-containing protein [Deltaproteobacteria bacterium]
MKSDSILLDRHGEVLHELRTDFNRRRLDWVPLKDISPALIRAVTQGEDKRFYDHSGVDYRSVAIALLQGLTLESLRGASTITMQLASLLDKELQPRKGKRSIRQKAKQAMTALKVERSWSKTEILEAYLNLVSFRGELQGIAAGSRILFGKTPQGLDRSESLILASLIRSPNASLESLQKRAGQLDQSLRWNVGPQEISFTGQIRDRFQHHLLPLRSQNVRDGAALVMENQTGEILAYVSISGRPSETAFVDGVQAKRQAGSILKPFLYALAFERRILTPASLLNDSPLDLAVASGVYHPRNYDGQFRGRVTARTALASSLNIPAVETLSLVGADVFLQKLRQMGVRGLNEAGDFYGPSLAVGAADVSLWELVNAYRSLANGGEWSEPRFTAEGNDPFPSKKLFSREAVYLVSDILSDREARSITFGLENPLSTRFWTAVKTGTSKDMRDNWCVGYSRKYTVGVWVGNFTGDSMWNVSGITGAAPLWAEIINFLHRHELESPRRMPPNLVQKRIEFPAGVEPPREEWFIGGTEPTALKQSVAQAHQRIIYPPNGAILAIDPDIPNDPQKIFFTSQVHDPGSHWVLNGLAMDETGKSIPWVPRGGKHLLTIINADGRIIDSIRFEVRGSSDDGDL